MRFGLSEDQQLLQETSRRFLEDHVSVDAIRDFATGDDKAIGAIVNQGLAELGMTLVLVPEAHGGLGMNLLEAALIQQMLGRTAAPANFMAPYAMASIALQAASADQQAQYYGGIADGTIRFGMGVSEAVATQSQTPLAIENNKANGTARFVLDAEGATHFIIANKSATAIIKADAKGVDCEALTTIDKTRDFAMLHFTDADCEMIECDIERVIAAGRILLAADSLGVCDMMLEKAVAYAKEREQFNRVIASFQAVKHLCAEMAAEIEPCRSLLWYAAYAFDEVPEESALMSRLVKAKLSDVGRFVARTATEVHGGMGFTDLLGLHYWYKRAGVNRTLLGAPELVRAEAAKIQWG